MYQHSSARNLTNLSKSQIANPRFWNFAVLAPFPPTDNYGNKYPATTQTVERVSATSGRYKPGESSIELLMIRADELVDNISEIRIGLGDSGFFPQPHFCVLERPAVRERDFDSARPDPPQVELPAAGRRSLLPPSDRRR